MCENNECSIETLRPHYFFHWRSSELGRVCFATSRSPLPHPTQLDKERGGPQKMKKFSQPTDSCQDLLSQEKFEYPNRVF